MNSFVGKARGIRRLLALSVVVMMIISVCSACGSEETTVETNTLSLGRDLSKYEKDIVQYATDIGDTVCMGYNNGSRNVFSLSNQDMGLKMDLVGQKKLSEMSLTGGQSMTTSAGEMHIVTKDGREFVSTNSLANGRMNVYSHGLYYYDAHLLDLAATNQQALDGAKIAKSYNFDEDTLTDDWGDMVNSECTIEDKKLVFKSTGSAQDDHSITNKAVDMKVTNDDGSLSASHLRLQIKTAEACNLSFSWASDFFLEHGEEMNVTADTLKATIPIAPSDEEKTYYIPLKNNQHWANTIEQFTLKLTSKVGTEVSIDNMEFISLVDEQYPAMFDFGYYMYPNKLHEQNTAVFTGTAKDMESVYSQVTFAENDLKSIFSVNRESNEVSDVTKSAKEGMDIQIEETSALMFETSKGCIGYIFPEAVDNGKVEIALDNGTYYFRQFADLSKTEYELAEKVSVARRIYTQTEYNQQAFQDEIFIELNPLSKDTGAVELVKNKKYKSEYHGYNPVEGYYEIGLEGRVFQPAYDEPEYGPSTEIRIKNDLYNRKIYMKAMTSVDPGCLEAAVVLDEDGYQIPIGVQVSKNFTGENEEPIYRPEDPAFGDSYYPLSMAPNEQLHLTTKHLFQSWGNHDLKQISSILFWTPYYHLSTGCTETSCWAPMLYNSKNGFSICDYRGFSNDMWEGQPQHDSIGEHYFIRYKAQDGTELDSLNYYKTSLDSVGPNYSDFIQYFRTDDNRADVEIRSVEMPQTDETRLLTEVKFRVNEDFVVENARENFSLYDITSGISNISFAQAGFLNEENKPVTKTTKEMNQEAGGDDKSIVYSLGDENPFLALFESLPGGSNSGNCGAIVDTFEASIDGDEYDIGDLSLVFQDWEGSKVDFGKNDHREPLEGYKMRTKLTIDAETLNFKKGDTITMKLLMSPYGSIRDKTCDTILDERETLRNNPFVVESKVTEVREDFVPVINAEGKDEVAFSVSGVGERMPVKVEGYDDYKPPRVYQSINGKQKEIKLSTEALDGKDGTQAYVTKNGKYGFVLLLDADGKKAEYRVVKSK